MRAKGTGIVAGLSSRVALSHTIKRATNESVHRGLSRSVGQRIVFPVKRGHTYTVTKYVGVVTSQQDPRPGAAARRQSAAAAATGFARLLRHSNRAWSRLWSGRIDVLGNRQLASEVNASQFYLWSSTRKGSPWSISPAGLSSDGYNGHIFWDAETWMYPSLLAQHPHLAAGMDTYRYQRLGAAKRHARNTGYRGARYPWESALDGTEQMPPPASVNSEGLYEQHITADIALAQWQYCLATGDRTWLRRRGWPVISQAARFWASRVTPGSGGSYHILGVTGPDEENPDVDDSAYTNVAAAATLRAAARAAQVLGVPSPKRWHRVADGLTVPYDPVRDIHPEFDGYQGQLVKQADVTMLQYPWELPMPDRVAQRDLNFYVPRTDPQGPSMSDAINSIDTAALGSPGCGSYVYTLRSIEPFIRDQFDQFSETRTGGAFTFTTGIGGFLQEFLYGYSGLRWSDRSVHLDPSLTGQLNGLILHNIAWHGRRFTLTIGPTRTQISLEHGPALPITIRGASKIVTHHRPLSVATRRPDQLTTADLVRCQAASASSAQPGADAIAAVDGSPATDWQPASVPATLTVPIDPGTQRISTVLLRWGQQFPPAPAPNVPPPPKPVTTLRASTYQLSVSPDGHHWKTVAQVRHRSSGILDRLSFPPVRARYLRLHITATTHHTPPQLTELRVTQDQSR